MHWQMGTSMKPTIFNDRVATALKNWHHTAKKHIKQSKNNSTPTTPTSSHPTTPTHGTSPMHLLRHYRSDIDSPSEHWDAEGSPSPTRFYHPSDRILSLHTHIEVGDVEHEAELRHEAASSQVAPLPESTNLHQHEIDIGGSKVFSFDRRTST